MHSPLSSAGLRHCPCPCRAVTFTAISRNSAQNILAPAVMAAPSRSPMLSRPPPLQKPKKQQHALAAPSLVILAAA